MKTLLLLFISFGLFAQGFLPGTDMYSRKKPAYITLTDGSEIEGVLKTLNRKKGNIMSVTLDSPKKMTLAAEEVASMYLPSSGLDKLGKTADAVFTVQKWDNKDLNLKTIEEGYAYFEQTKVDLKGKEMLLLMQLVNPHFSNKMRVYFDPYARETMAVGMAGLTVAGGLDKSYFLKVGDAPAFKLEKKNYEELYPELFRDCPALVEKIKADPDWKDLDKHIFEYSGCN